MDCQSPTPTSRFCTFWWIDLQIRNCDFNLPRNQWVSLLQKSKFAVLVLGFEKLGLQLDNFGQNRLLSYLQSMPASASLKLLSLKSSQFLNSVIVYLSKACEGRSVESKVVELVELYISHFWTCRLLKGLRLLCQSMPYRPPTKK